MTGPIRLLAVGILLSFLAQISAAFGHDARPAYLEISETSPQRYTVVWRTPVYSGARLPVLLKLPDSARDVREPVTQRLTDSIVERRIVETGDGGLAGEQVQFLGLQATITDVLVRVAWLDGSETTTIVRPSQPWLTLAASQSGWQVARDYAILGVEHILIGIDHLLFVLALLLITSGTWQLIKTVTAFTVAHSITLSLAALGVVHVPQKPVEAVIALSIVFVAAEIIRARRGVVGVAASAPWVVAFIFGLLHGLGFAGALSEIGLPQSHIPTALLFFNIGVEIGQLIFIAAVLAVIAIARHIRIGLPRWAELMPPYLIGCVAMFWVFERVIA